MSQIVAVILNSLKSHQSFLEAEQDIMIQVSQLFTKAFGTALEELDRELCLEQSDQPILHRDQRTIQLVCGNVSYRRRLVEQEDGRHSYLLDEYLGLRPRVRYSDLLIQRVSQLASKGVLRSVAEAVSVLTPVSMSHQTVWKITQVAGQAIDEIRIAEADYRETTVAERKQLPVLFVEGDAFMIKGKGKFHKQLMVHRFQVYEGVELNGQRRRLINRHVISSLSHSTVLKELKAYLDQHYDLSKTKLITGSDNGSGYTPSVFDDIAGMAQSHQHILDRYHLNRKIRTRLSTLPKQLVNGLIKAINHGHFNQISAYLDTAESLAVDREALADVQLLRAYFRRNWPSIEPLGNPGFAHVVHSLGSCESNHRRYTYRLKHQGRSWTKAGLTAMLRVIDAQQNNDLEATLIKRPDFAKPLAPKIPRLIPKLLKQVKTTHQGIHHGSIVADAAYSSPIGHLAQIFNNSI